MVTLQGSSVVEQAGLFRLGRRFNSSPCNTFPGSSVGRALGSAEPEGRRFKSSPGSSRRGGVVWKNTPREEIEQTPETMLNESHGAVGSIPTPGSLGAVVAAVTTSSIRNSEPMVRIHPAPTPVAERLSAVE